LEDQLTKRVNKRGVNESLDEREILFLPEKDGKEPLVASY
jgi:hypothetical protein